MPTISPLSRRLAPWLALAGLGVLVCLILSPFLAPLAWGGAGAWLLFHGEVGAAIGIWIWGAAVVSQLDNVVRPLLISSAGAIPLLVVLFGVLGGLLAFGLIGGLLAFGLIGLFIGPIVLAIALAVWREWTEHLDQAPPTAPMP
jgi:predicted PurR-regulated permease PerM